MLFRSGVIEDHCHQTSQCELCCVDEVGHLYLKGGRGLGLVHSQDVGVAADLIEQGLWRVTQVSRQQLPEQFRFVRSPLALTV